MRNLSIYFFTLIFISTIIHAQNKEPKISPDSDMCITCHETITPGIVEDWKRSRHSTSTVAQAFGKVELERRISLKELPEAEWKDYVVGCYECHSQNVDKHSDSFDHFGVEINVVVSPNDCKTCHPVEVDQYSHSKKSLALDILEKNSVYMNLINSVTSIKEIEGIETIQKESSYLAKSETCYACHGTEVKAEGLKTIETNLGEIEVPNLTNWPNHGVGRINPDGSKGACTSCHPRHQFSIKVARQPHTCGQCHLEPDVPAYNVYKESKHGNIFSSQKNEWNWNEVPWKIGEDFQTPTCASCHNALITTPSGDVIVERSHNFADRLYVRLFGLIYSHAQPKSAETWKIKNDDGLPLPTSLAGEPAVEFLIDEKEQAARKAKMQAVCKSCHGTSWTENHFEKLDGTLVEADKMVEASTQLMLQAWDQGIEDNTNIFDEDIELHWVRQWLYYGNSLRYAAAMSGPDYAAFKNGWFELTHNLQKMKEKIKAKSK